MTGNRLLPHHILESYHVSNVVPMNNGYLRFDSDTKSWCGCALSAYYLANHSEYTPEQAFGLTTHYGFDDDTIYAEVIKPWLIKQKQFHPEYLSGFMDGYDDPKHALLHCTTLGMTFDDRTAHYQNGYYDGSASWDHVSSVMPSVNQASTE